MLPPDAHHSLIGDIDENLAADFDGSLSGLGVDINSATYSMNEALLALPTLSMFKPEIQRYTFKNPDNDFFVNI